MLILAAVFARRGDDSAKLQRTNRADSSGTVVLSRLPPMRAKGCTDTWIASQSTTAWEEAGNWSAARTPTKDDRACIPDGGLVTLSKISTTVGSLVAEGTLSLERGAVLDLDNPGQRSSFEVLDLGFATLKGRSPVEVLGTFTWDSGGGLDGPAPMHLARHSQTIFDGGDGGWGVIRRPLVADGLFTLSSGAIYLLSTFTNRGHFDVTTKSPRGFAAGFLDGKRRPITTGDVTTDDGKIHKKAVVGTAGPTPGLAPAVLSP